MNTETFRCRVCGTAGVYENPMQGATNVGHFEKATGWKLVWETFEQIDILTCPECLLKAREASEIIQEMYGTLDISMLSIGVDS